MGVFKIHWFLVQDVKVFNIVFAVHAVDNGDENVLEICKSKEMTTN